MKEMNINKLIFAFVLLLLIGLLSAFYTINKMEDLSENTKKMYTHPFAVSNAVANINISIFTIHRDMKDVVLSKSHIELLKIIEKIQKEESNAYKNFDIVYENFLGDINDIHTSYKLFKEWKTIRDKVIVDISENKVDRAISITKGEGAEHIENLYKQISILRNYAFNKARGYYLKSVDNSGITEVIWVMVIAFTLSFFIVIFIIYTLIKVNKENRRQLHLIDQNILIAVFDTNKKVMNISNALCRIFNARKEDIIGQKNEYFFTTKNQYMLFDKQIFSGKEFRDEVYIILNDEKVWFNIEIIPHLNNNYNIESFNLFLTNISDKKMIEKISITDSLTGLNNRNYFEMILEKEVRRAKRDKKDITFIVLDIDFFKQYNDAYGHPQGDKALQSVSNIIAKHTNRSYDYSFRIGGEEFSILTYRDSFEEAKQLVELIIHEVESLKITHKKSHISDVLTISAGCAYFKDSHFLNPDEMFKKADDLLYESKQDGRNMVTAEIIE